MNRIAAAALCLKLATREELGGADPPVRSRPTFDVIRSLEARDSHSCLGIRFEGDSPSPSARVCLAVFRRREMRSWTRLPSLE